MEELQAHSAQATEQLTQTITALESSCSKLSEQLEQQRQTCVAKEQQLADVQQQHRESVEQRDEVQQRLTRREEEMQALREKSQILQAEMKSSLCSLADDLQRVQTELDDARREQVMLERQHQVELARSEQRLEEMQQQHAGESQELQRVIQSLTMSLEQVTASQKVTGEELAVVQSAAEALKLECEDRKKALGEVQAALAASKDQVAALVEERRALDESTVQQLREFRGVINELHKTTDEVTEQLVNARKANAEMQISFQGQRESDERRAMEQVACLNSAYAKLQQEVQTLIGETGSI